MASLVRLLRFLLRSSEDASLSRASLGLAVASSLFAGAVSTGFIALINTLLTDREGLSRMLWWFVALCVLLPLFRFLSSYLLVRLTQKLRLQIERVLSRRILAAPLRRLEDVGPPRLLAALTEDVDTVVNALGAMPLILMHLTVIFGCLVYLGILSWKLLLLVLGVMLVGVLAYQVTLNLGNKHFRRSRELSDEVYGHFRSLTDGIKELKIHRPRRLSFFRDHLAPALAQRSEHRVTAQIHFALAGGWGQVLFFMVIGVVLFGSGWTGENDAAALTGYTLAILYMLTPLDVVLNQMPVFNRANISVERIQELGLDLEADAELRAPLAEKETARPEWRTLELRGVSHRYPSPVSDDEFTLGPLDLTLRRGECLFLVGGNGSGKTSLAKILIGLYAPETGNILLDGEPVGPEDMEAYRGLFSVVFSDFFLFPTLMGVGDDDLRARGEVYLERLHLAHKVRLDEGGELSTLKLSQGQRKRLALLTAYLEDRSIYVFDEWAADQDPVFKEIFYRDLVPGLLERGKTVVVISHDDRYYSTAERLVKLESGQVRSDSAALPTAAGVSEPVEALS